MKRILTFLFLFTCFSGSLFAQKKWNLLSQSSYDKPSRDNAMIQFGYCGWTNLPDSIKTTGIGRFFNAYITYDFPIQKSNFSFAAGAGLSSNNIFLSDQEMVLNDTTTYVRFIPEAKSYKKYKFSSNYLEAPFEIRYFSDKADRNKGIKAALGLKIGLLLNTHTKGRLEVNKKPVIEKVSAKRYVDAYRYTFFGRIGYGNFTLYGGYSLNNLFKTNLGPENIKPFQLGICISGL